MIEEYEEVLTELSRSYSVHATDSETIWKAATGPYWLWTLNTLSIAALVFLIPVSTGPSIGNPLRWSKAY